MKRILRAVLLVSLAISGGAFAQPITNDCADPYWVHSLRCAALHPVEPQPVPAPPASPAQVKEYTRVNLDSDWEVRCLDGTRPILYVDPAVGGPSNRWLFSMSGGGSCWARDSDPVDGVYDDAQGCVDDYLGGEESEMGTASEPAMRNLADQPGLSQGILRTATSENPVFAGYNRVRVKKCSYDRYNGRAAHPSVTGEISGPETISFDLYSQGRSILELALDELRGNDLSGIGLSYPTWIVAGNAVVATTESLPPLESAEQIVFIGHSGAGHGLYHSIDGLADYLRAWPAFAGDVRVVIDSNFVPGPENEKRFESPSLDLYDHFWSGTTAALGSYDAETFLTDSAYVEQYDSYLAAPTDSLATILDASCVSVHAGTGDEWSCRDRLHVLANHLATPAFVREDFSDPNSEHTANGFGHLALWGPIGAYAHCAVLGLTTCPPLIEVGDGSPYEGRLYAQAGALLSGFQLRSELARGDDPSGPVPSLFLWMPDCGSHASAYSDQQFSSVALSNGVSSVTMRDWLGTFVSVPATGITAARIAGFGGDVALCDGDLPFRDSFESADSSAWSSATP
ncbi:MAG: pectin acetylesterase-family hydrolase [Thermoanaerobaculia bacterium]